MPGAGSGPNVGSSEGAGEAGALVVRTSEAVALLFPGVGVVVVAVALPEAEPVDGGELDGAEPLGALPEVLPRDHEPRRPAVLLRQGLAVGVRRDERVLVLEEGDRHVRGEVMFGVGDREAGGLEGSAELRKLAPVHPFEL